MFRAKRLTEERILKVRLVKMKSLILMLFIVLLVGGCANQDPKDQLPAPENKNVLPSSKDKLLNPKEFNDINDLKHFAEKGFGGGKLIMLKDGSKEIYIADLLRTSGVVSTETHIFLKVGEKYKLIKKLGLKIMHYRSYSLSSNKLIVKLTSTSSKKEKLESIIKIP